MRIWLLITLFALGLKSYSQDSLNVLFLGNSLTYSNDIPDLTRQLALSNNDHLTYSEHTPGGWMLNTNHLNSSISNNLIKSRQWDYVVLQGQSREFIYENEYTTYKGIRRMVTRMTENCSRPAFYSTAAQKTLYKTLQPYIHQQYTNIANEVDGLIIPVGNAFTIAMDQNINVYSDKIHPNLAGSYLAACTFYAAMFQKSPIGLSFNAGLSASAVTQLQTIADQVVMGHFTDLNIHNNPSSCSKSIGIKPVALPAVPAFSIYPNPAKDAFTLKIETDAAIEATASVYDMQGNKVLEQTILLEEGMNTFSYGFNFPAGVYTIFIKSRLGDYTPQKLIVL